MSHLREKSQNKVANMFIGLEESKLIPLSVAFIFVATAGNSGLNYGSFGLFSS